jgi:putative hemolysin
VVIGGQILLLVILLFGSAFFSGGETALFSLTLHQRDEFARSRHRPQRWAAALIRQPDRLLVTLLLGNMAVNVLFFATGSLLALKVAGVYGGGLAAVAGFAPLLAIILFGEVLPKVAALSRPGVVATLVAGPIRVLTTVLTPVRVVLERLCIRPALRILAPQPRIEGDDGPITHEQLQLLFQHSAHRGIIDVSTRTLLHEVVELHDIKVREVMVPRVDMVAFDLAGTRDALIAELRRSHLKRMPVYRGDFDHIVGIVHSRDVLLNPDQPVEQLVRPILFVPELATLERLLEQLRVGGRQLAIAVDEYGGAAGLVTLEDVVEEIVGELHDPNDKADEPYRRISDDEYRVRGDLSIRDWSELFGHRIGTPRADTLAGLVAAELGRVPVKGDRVCVRNLELTVEAMRRRRVEWVHLRRLNHASVDGAEGSEEH